MSDSKSLRTGQASRRRARKDAVYARTAADDEAGTACRAQVRRAQELAEPPGGAAIYADPATSGLDAGRPGLRQLLADARRGGLRRVVVRDLTRLARSAGLLEEILSVLRVAGVELLTLEGANHYA